MDDINEYSFNNLHYKTDGKSISNSKILFDEASIPETVIKFYANTEFSRNAVINKYLYLAHDSQFNDVFEANNNLYDFSQLTEKQYNEYYDLHYVPIEKRSSWTYTEDKKLGFPVFKQIHKVNFDRICSLSLADAKNRCNSLMWSHYAIDRGFAIELDTDKLIKCVDKGIFDYLFFPINNVDCLQQFDPYNEKLGGRMGSILYIISTKIKNGNMKMNEG